MRFPRFHAFLVCLAMLSGNIFFGQEITTISGRVTDTLDQPLENINVLIQTKVSGQILAFDFTNQEGLYTLELEESGDLDIIFKGLGYETVQLDISAKLKNTRSLRKDIQLKEKNEVLQEVIIEAQSNIQVKKDTILINADAFRTGNEEVLEDLFRNIPGLSVGKDGTIKVGNRSIEKVMVEGDDFFGRGYKLMTKNMDPNSIEKVEIYHNYSSNKLLKGIENTDKVALNVTLKEENKYEWFGNISAGYDALLEDRYLGRINLMSFGKKNKFYLLTTLNNIGLDSKGSIEDLTKTSEDELISDLGEDVGTYSFFHSDYGQIPYFEDTRVNFNDSELVSLNGIFNLSEKIKMKLLAFSHWNDRLFPVRTLRRYKLQDSEVEIDEESRTEKSDFDIYLKLQMDYDVSPNANIKFLSTLSHSTFQSFSDFEFNNDKAQSHTEEEVNFLDQAFSYTRKIGKSTVVDISGRLIEEKSPQFFTTNENALLSLTDNENLEEDILQSVDQTLKFRGIEANYLNRISEKTLFEIKAGYTNTANRLETYLNVIAAENEDYSGDFLHRIQSLYVVPKYATTWKEFTFSGALGLTQHTGHLFLKPEVEKENEFLLNPQVGLNWQINGTNKILTQYSRSLTHLETYQVAPVNILRDYRSIVEGLAYMNPLVASNVIVNYSSGSWGDRFFANVLMSYTHRHDYLSTRSFINPEVEKIERTLFKDQDLLNLSASIDQYLEFFSSNLKLKAGFATTEFQSIVKNDFIDVEAENYNLGFEFKSAFSSAFNFHLGTEWLHSSTYSTREFVTDRNFSFLDLIYTPNNRLNFSLKTESYFLEDSFSDSEWSLFLNFDARYTLIKNKLALQLHGQNLTNTENYTYAYSSEISSVETTYKLIPRYILLKLDYRF